MRLSLLLHKPLHEVILWPADEVLLYQHYLAREPSSSERIEYALAQITKMLSRGVYTVQLEKLPQSGSKISDFMLFDTAWDWQPNTGNSDLDHDLRILRDRFGDRLVVLKPNTDAE